MKKCNLFLTVFLFNLLFLFFSCTTNEGPDDPANSGGLKLIENFENVDLPPFTSDYNDGSFTNSTTGITWNYVQSRDDGNQTQESGLPNNHVYTINGQGLQLRRPSSNSCLYATFPDGVGIFSFKYRQARTGDFTRQFVVLVNGEQKFISDPFGGTNGSKTAIYTFSETINEEGPVTIKIAYPATVLDGALSDARQITVDDIEWTNYPEQ
jgi:hypothetical protein